jgi:hypothetical protein
MGHIDLTDYGLWSLVVINSFIKNAGRGLKCRVIPVLSLEDLLRTFVQGNFMSVRLKNCGRNSRYD